MPKPIHIFKAGTHTAASGDTLSFSESDLQAAAAAYSPDLHEAPLVVGHPKNNAPAYGWVRELAFAEGDLTADPHQVNPDFEEMLKGGSFKKVSASFYRPDSPQNPAPGSYYLRHVGFLGAQPPAIKGLRGLEFSDKEKPEDTIEFEAPLDFQSPWTLGAIATVFRKMRDYLIEKDGVDKADQIIPDYTISSLEDDARREVDQALGEEFNEGGQAPITDPKEDITMPLTPEEVAAKEAEFQARDAELKTREQNLNATVAAQTKAAAEDYAETLAKTGLIAAGMKSKVAAVMVALDTADEVDFAEGNGDPTKVKPTALMRDIFASIKPSVNFDEYSNPNEGGGTNAITEQEITNKARAHVRKAREEGQAVSYAEAVRHVTAGLNL